MAPQDFGWAIIGPGSIAGNFAAALHAVPGARLQSVWGRDETRARAFASQHGVDQDRVASELDALLVDPSVHAVYVATTNQAHLAFVERALEAGKPVLCEKPLTARAIDTQRLIALSRARRVFLMEALWTRMLPLYRQLDQRLRDGAIGELRSVFSSFCFAVPYAPRSRWFNPALGGGALLDIGVYNVAMSRWAVQSAHGEPDTVTSRTLDAVRAPTGVDISNAGSLRFSSGVVAQFICAFDRVGGNGLVLHGTRGSVCVRDAFWAAQEAELIRADGSREVLGAPHAVNGFEYQIEEAMRCIRAGLLESEHMPHAESEAVAHELDALISLAGVAPCPSR